MIAGCPVIKILTDMTAFQSLLKSSMANSVDADEIKEALLNWKNEGVGLIPGLIEERWDFDAPHNSKEWKLWRKISEYSYEYHRLDENEKYVHAENEHR